MSNTIKIVQQHGLPFKEKNLQGSKELADAIEDAKRLEANPNTKCYTDMNEMWADLDK
ncbi:hypothetical protein [Fibrobacter sp.]|jgi:DNA-damage-inducible protein J|uniref:hypothetical protein n=1 Tax=Fibrobacter sp. TaxID=35828 RepID=UPI00262933D4|nr:hypothetical protein [Fibrobacter sp.]MDD5941323.1 hypothetical protein [Fibrobacter sp.]